MLCMLPSSSWGILRPCPVESTTSISDVGSGASRRPRVLEEGPGARKLRTRRVLVSTSPYRSRALGMKSLSEQRCDVDLGGITTPPSLPLALVVPSHHTSKVWVCLGRFSTDTSFRESRKADPCHTVLERLFSESGPKGMRRRRVGCINAGIVRALPHCSLQSFQHNRLEADHIAF